MPDTLTHCGGSSGQTLGGKTVSSPIRDCLHVFYLLVHAHCLNFSGATYSRILHRKTISGLGGEPFCVLMNISSCVNVDDQRNLLSLQQSRQPGA